MLASFHGSSRLKTIGVRRRMRAVTGLMLLGFSLNALSIADARSQIRVETFSGSGEAGFADSDGQVGRFNRPHGLAIDAKGNVYVSDRGNHAVRLVTANGDISTLAGTGREGE